MSVASGCRVPAVGLQSNDKIFLLTIEIHGKEIQHACSIEIVTSSERCLHVPRRSVGTSDDTWQIEMNCAFPGPTATHCCSCCQQSSAGR